MCGHCLRYLLLGFGWDPLRIGLLRWDLEDEFSTSLVVTPRRGLILALPCLLHMTLDKLFHLSEPQ